MFRRAWRKRKRFGLKCQQRRFDATEFNRRFGCGGFGATAHAQVGDELAGMARANTVDQLKRTKPAHFVERVFQDSEERQQVLDVGRLDELEATVFHKRNVAASQLDFQQIAVMAGAKKNRLLSQGDALFALVQYFFANDISLLGLIQAGDQPGQRTGGALAPQAFGVFFGGRFHDAVRQFQDGRC